VPVDVGAGGVKEQGRSQSQWIGGREESEGGKPRVRLRDVVLQAEECTPTKRIGGLSGDGNKNKHVVNKKYALVCDLSSQKREIVDCIYWSVLRQLCAAG
jgi:hypothetical protein